MIFLVSLIVCGVILAIVLGARGRSRKRDHSNWPAWFWANDAINNPGANLPPGQHGTSGGHSHHHHHHSAPDAGHHHSHGGFDAGGGHHGGGFDGGGSCGGHH